MSLKRVLVLCLAVQAGRAVAKNVGDSSDEDVGMAWLPTQVHSGARSLSESGIDSVIWRADTSGGAAPQSLTAPEAHEPAGADTGHEVPSAGSPEAPAHGEPGEPHGQPAAAPEGAHDTHHDAPSVHDAPAAGGHDAPGEAAHGAGEGGHGSGEHGGTGHEEEGEGHHKASEVDVGISAMLFGSVSFVMFLFYLVNHSDADIRRYSWSTISTTMTIFAAVLTFSGIDELVKMLLHTRTDVMLMSYAVFFLLFLVLQATIAYVAGVIGEPEAVELEEEVWVIADALRVDFGEQVAPEEVRNVSGVKSVAYREGMEVFVQKKKFAKETRQRRMKCWALLIAHMAGFANINAGGALQHMRFFRQNPLTASLAVVVNQLVLFFLFRGANLFRHRCCRNRKTDLRTELFIEEVREAENDVASLSISFLTVQALRFAFSGTLPKTDGGERSPEPKDGTAVLALYLAGLAFALGAALLLMARRSIRGSVIRCVALVLQNTWAMSFAWSLLFATTWYSMGSPAFHTIAPYGPTSMVGTLILALALSAFALIVIFVLDKIDDTGAGGADMGRVVQNFINALSILVGFSWEHCFDHGVETLASVTERPVLMKVLITIAVILGIIPAWRRYILQRVLTLRQMHQERLRALAKENGSDDEAESGVSTSSDSSEAPFLGCGF